MSPRAPGPKHRSVAETLARDIRAGRVPHRLPGENALATRFDVSRNTVRQALGDLTRAGLITTRPGRGSFVVYDDVPLDARHGWAVALAARGVRTHVDTLRVAEVTDTALAERLDLGSDLFIAVDRLRSVIDGPAISYERSRVPAVGALRDLPTHGLVGGSLTATLLAAGLCAAHGEEWAGARPLSDDEARVLGRTPTDWFLQVRRVTRTVQGGLVEHVESALDPAHFQLHLEFD